jgi:hypothetical protein
MSLSHCWKVGAGQIVPRLGTNRNPPFPNLEPGYDVAYFDIS